MQPRWHRWAVAALLGMIVPLSASGTAAASTDAKATIERLEREWRVAVTARLKSSTRARDALLAAMLSPITTDADREARALLMRQALERAGDDALVWWIAASDCPTTSAACDAPRARARLREIAADNAAVWWLGVRVATGADGSTTVLATDLALDAHLQGAAAATRYDSYMDELLREAVQALLAVPPALELLAGLDPHAFGATPTPKRLAFVEALGHALAIAMPSHSPILGVCREPLPPARREPCLRALTIQTQADDVIANAVAHSALLRLLPAGTEREAIRAERREHAWLRAATLELQSPEGFQGPLDAEQLDCFIAERLQPGGDELRAMRACLQAAGVGLTPPLQWNPEGPKATAATN